MEKKNKSNLLWVVVLLIVFTAIGSNYYFANSQPLLLCVIEQIVLVGVALFLIAKTTLGQKLCRYCQEALVEVRKVVWPTKKETIQATLGVLVMVVVMGILLWSVDAVLLRLVGWLIGR